VGLWRGLISRKPGLSLVVGCFDAGLMNAFLVRWLDVSCMAVWMCALMLILSGVD